MRRYIFRRLLVLLPLLVIITLITFFISVSAPGDPFLHVLKYSESDFGGDRDHSVKEYKRLRKEAGLDLPVFYISFGSFSEPADAYDYTESWKRDLYKRLSHFSGNSKQSREYIETLSHLDTYLKQNNYPQVKNIVNELYHISQTDRIKTELIALDLYVKELNDDVLDDRLYELNKAFEKLTLNTAVWKSYIPVLRWNGIGNQYHRWVFGTRTWFGGEEDRHSSGGILRGDFGISYKDRRPVLSVIADALPWTIVLSLLSIILSYAIAIPLGIYTAVNKDSGKERFITGSLFLAYSIPTFWVATMLILLLGGGDYFSLFPVAGTGYSERDSTFLSKLMSNAHHLVLPLICLTYPSLAFITRQMRGSMLNTLNMDYIRTARAKGLPERVVILRHAFRNSLLPMITMLANLFPAVISGSLVIEYIFTIPGMGFLTWNALLARDYPVLFTILLFTAALTLAGYLISDLLYSIADPRIRYAKNVATDHPSKP